MAMTITQIGRDKDGAPLMRAIETGSANTVLTATCNMGGPGRVLHAEAIYSNTPVQAGVTFGIDAGAGAGYDANLSVAAANTRHNIYSPPGEGLALGGDDAFFVTAPAGGANISCSVSVTLKQLPKA